jgi:hypothetical protein
VLIIDEAQTLMRVGGSLQIAVVIPAFLARVVAGPRLRHTIAVGLAKASVTRRVSVLCQKRQFLRRSLGTVRHPAVGRST